MTCDQSRSDYLLYALGTVEELKRVEISAHVNRGCENCTTGLREAYAVAVSMGAALDGPEPSPALRERVQAIPRLNPRATADRSRAEKRGPSFWFRPMPLWQTVALASACLAIALAPGLLWYRQLADSQAGRDAAAARLAREQRTSASLREQVARLESRAVPIFALELERGAPDVKPARQLIIPKDAAAVVLALPIDLVKQASAAELRDASGRVIWSGSPLPAGEYSVVLRAGERDLARMRLRVSAGN